MVPAWLIPLFVTMNALSKKSHKKSYIGGMAFSHDARHARFRLIFSTYLGKNPITWHHCTETNYSYLRHMNDLRNV